MAVSDGNQVIFWFLSVLKIENNGKSGYMKDYYALDILLYHFIKFYIILTVECRLSEYNRPKLKIHP